MKVCFSADWHVSNFGADQAGPLTERGRACLRVVRRLYALPGIDHHVGLGDIFDLDKPSPGLVRALQDEISAPTHLLVGNHDQTSEEPSHHALAPLVQQAKVVEDLEHLKVEKAHIALIGFRQRPDVVEKISSIDWSDRPFRVVGFHLGVAEHDTPEFLRNTRDSIALDELVQVCKAAGVTHAFAGNWHNPDDWHIDGVTICQVGGMVPQRYGDPFDEHGRVALFDTQTGSTTYEHLAGPRFVTIRGAPPWTPEIPPDADPLWLRYQVDTKDKAQAFAHAKKLTPKRNTRVEDTDTSPEFEGLIPTVTTARDAALEYAHTVGGPELVDYVATCMTKVKK